MAFGWLNFYDIMPTLSSVAFQSSFSMLYGINIIIIISKETTEKSSIKIFSTILVLSRE